MSVSMARTLQRCRLQVVRPGQEAPPARRAAGAARHLFRSRGIRLSAPASDNTGHPAVARKRLRKSQSNECVLGSLCSTAASGCSAKKRRPVSAFAPLPYRPVTVCRRAKLADFVLVSGVGISPIAQIYRCFTEPCMQVPRLSTSEMSVFGFLSDRFAVTMPRLSGEPCRGV
jgi:hypothetical protein